MYIPKVKSVYIVSKLVCILLAKWCVGIGDPISSIRFDVLTAVLPVKAATLDAVLDGVLEPVGVGPLPFVAAATTKPLAALKDVGAVLYNRFRKVFAT